MSRRALHTFCSRSRQDFLQSRNSDALSVRQFSTSEYFFDQSNNNNNNNRPAPPPGAGSPSPNRPSGRQRSQAAANELGSLLGSSNRPGPTTTYANRTGPPNAGRAPGKVLDIRNLRPGFGRGLLSQRGGQRAPGSGPPREGLSFPSRGGPGAISFRGGRGAGGSVGLPRGGFFNRGGRGGSGMRGGTGLRGFGRGGRGGGRGGRGGREGRGGKERSRDSDPESNMFTVLESDIKEFDTPKTREEYDYIEKRERGLPEVYNPSTSLGSLSGHGPALATESNPWGVAETVRTNLRLIGGERHYETQGNIAPAEAARMLRRENLIYFTEKHIKQEVDDFVKQRRDEAAAAKGEERRPDEKDSVILPLQDSIKSAIVRQAVQGQYEQPPQVAKINDAAGMARAVQLQNGTYTPEDRQKFHDKLVSLLPKDLKAAAKALPQPF